MSIRSPQININAPSRILTPFLKTKVSSFDKRWPFEVRVVLIRHSEQLFYKDILISY